MHNFLKTVVKKARTNPKKIVFPEPEDERVLIAINRIIKEKIAIPILLGNPKKILNHAKQLQLDLDWEKIQIINPQNSLLKKSFSEKIFNLRKAKGIDKKKAQLMAKDPNYFGTMLVNEDLADGMVTGATHSTGDSIRPALQIIKTEEKFHKVSGIFFMALEKKLLLFADAAITIDPSPHDLVDIAGDTVKTAEKFGLSPRVAFLSFSTKGSADHPNIKKIQEALAIFQDKFPEIPADGEMQVDAALIPAIAKRKAPNSPIQGNANILIFPNLEAANISYKLVERLAKAQAIGPLLQGLRKPVNDLSRGCSVEDIFFVTAFTVCSC